MSAVSAIRSVVAALCLLPMSACASDPSPPPEPVRAAAAAPAVDGFEGGDWRLATLGGAPVRVPVEGARPRLLFDAATARVTGTTGVNGLTGGYRRDGASLRITGVATSLRAAIDDDATALESRFVGMLDVVRSWRRSADTLVLVDAEGRELATFTR